MEHEIYAGVLKYFCIYFHCRHVRVASECKEDSVCCCSNAALERKEAWRNDAALLFVHKEVRNIFSNFVCDRVCILEVACFVWNVALYNTYNLFRVYLEIRSSDTVGNLLDRNRLAVRWVEWFIYIVDADGFR